MYMDVFQLDTAVGAIYDYVVMINTVLGHHSSSLSLTALTQWQFSCEVAVWNTLTRLDWICVIGAIIV